MDAEELYEKLRRVVESEDLFVSDEADDMLADVCQAMTKCDPDDDNTTKRYTFGCGDPTEGIISFVAVVEALSEATALTALENILDQVENIGINPQRYGEDAVKSLTIYLNSLHVTVGNICKVEPLS